MVTEKVIQIGDLLINAIQWSWIFGVGLFAATQVKFEDDLYNIAVTVISMAAGTVVSYYLKKLLNRKNNKNERS